MANKDLILPKRNFPYSNFLPKYSDFFVDIGVQVKCETIITKHMKRI